MKSLSGREMGRVLERFGWTHTATNSSHFRYDRPGRHHIIVPVHGNKALKKGTQCAIMKAAGLRPQDLT